METSEIIPTNPVPNPGSEDALAIGCTCPVIDNCYGRGWRALPGAFIHTIGCPVHCPGEPDADVLAQLREYGDEIMHHAMGCQP